MTGAEHVDWESLRGKAIDIMRKAYAPYSHFPVGVAGIVDDEPGVARVLCAILGETPEVKNLFVATGFNSIGIQSSGGAGLVLSQWIKNGYPPMDVNGVDIRRIHPFQSVRKYVHDRTVESLGLLYAMHWPYRQVETARGTRRPFSRPPPANAARWRRPRPELPRHRGRGRRSGGCGVMAGAGSGRRGSTARPPFAARSG